MAIEKDPNDPTGLLRAVKSSVPGGTTEDTELNEDVLSEESKNKFFGTLRDVFQKKLDELELNKTLESIAESLQSSTKKTMSSIVQSVIPDVSVELKQISEKFTTGQDKDFEDALNRLDKIVKNTGVNLYDFSEKLGKNFDKLAQVYGKRTEKIRELEEEKEILKEKNIYTKIVDNNLTKEKELKILTLREQKDEINSIFREEKLLKDKEKQFEKEKNLILKQKETLNKTEQENIFNNEKILKQERLNLEKRKTDINYGDRQPTGIRAGLQTAGQFIRGERGSDFTRTLMGNVYAQFTAPFEAIKMFKDQVMGVAGFLKDLGKGAFKLTMLFGKLILAIIPFLIPVALVTLGLFALVSILKKIGRFFGLGKEDDAKADLQNKAQQNTQDQDIDALPKLDDTKSSFDKIIPEMGKPEGQMVSLRRKRERDNDMPLPGEFAQLNKDFMIGREIAAGGMAPIVTNIAPTNVANTKTSETFISPDVFNNDPTFLNLNVRTV